MMKKTATLPILTVTVRTMFSPARIADPDSDPVAVDEDAQLVVGLCGILGRLAVIEVCASELGTLGPAFVDVVGFCSV